MIECKEKKRPCLQKQDRFFFDKSAGNLSGVEAYSLNNAPLVTRYYYEV